MSISALQRDAFIKSDNFNEQVNGVLAKTAIYRAGAWVGLDDMAVQSLANVARSPASYGFTSVIVTDNNWSLTYDAWAADPAAADGEIESKVQTHWLMLTGIKEPVAPEPEP